MIPKTAMARIALCEGGWVFSTEDGFYTEANLREIASEIEARNTLLFAGLNELESRDPLLVERLEDDASF